MSYILFFKFFKGESFQTTNIFQSPAYKPTSNSLMPFDKSSYVLCSQALTCIGHLFSWIPLSNMITSHLLNTVFSFAAFGCESRHNVTTGSLLMLVCYSLVKYESFFNMMTQSRMLQFDQLLVMM